MPASLPTDDPEPFRSGVAALRAATVRPDLTVRETPAPMRVAPYAFALAAELPRGEDVIASGRLVYLHDPDGQPAWDGPSRLVAFVRADIDAEMAGDPLLGAVAWSWLHEALDHHGAGAHAAAGTATVTTSTRFGTLVDAPDTHELELRCSWSPAPDGPGAGLERHLGAWCDLLALTVGLPPVVAGVVPLASRRPRD